MKGSTSTEREAGEVVYCRGNSLHWPELDKDLSIAGLMACADWQSA